MCPVLNPNTHDQGELTRLVRSLGLHSLGGIVPDSSRVELKRRLWGRGLESGLGGASKEKTSEDQPEP